MVKQIIPAFTQDLHRVYSKDAPHLNVSEFFFDTIQGEGINIGQPAAFLRLKGCTLNCPYCDSTEVWRTGHGYDLNYLFKLMEDKGLIPKLWEQHLVITGGSPLIQQTYLSEFLHNFFVRYDFTPYVEIENECVIKPNYYLREHVDCWNNSPKLLDFSVESKSYRPAIIKYMAGLKNSWFKFVITHKNDWDKIQRHFLDPMLILRSQIILMPEGATREELAKHTELTVNMAVEHGVRYSDRLHISLWDKKTGV